MSFGTPLVSLQITHGKPYRLLRLQSITPESNAITPWQFKVIVQALYQLFFACLNKKALVYSNLDMIEYEVVYLPHHLLYLSKRPVDHRPPMEPKLVAPSASVQN